MDKRSSNQRSTQDHIVKPSQKYKIHISVIRIIHQMRPTVDKPIFKDQISWKITAIQLIEFSHMMLSHYPFVKNLGPSGQRDFLPNILDGATK